MDLIMIGCEYVGKTTLINNVESWLQENIGRSEFGPHMVHDHFILPFKEGDTEEAQEEAEYVRGMPPVLLEKHSRYMIDYHFQFFKDDGNMLVNWYYGHAVYARLYYGYGGRDDYADRQMLARWLESKVMVQAPGTILALVKASPETIRRRKSENPHPNCIVKDEDVELILQRFEEEYTRSGIRRKITLDTTDSTPEATFREFLKLAEPSFTDRDRLKMLAHRQVFQS